MAQRKRRPLLRPRFSLAALFGVMTLACVGVWYWYQWPYEVEHLEYSNRPDPFARGMTERRLLHREVETVRNVWSRDQSTMRHGPWAVYDAQGQKLQEGNYRNGAKYGAFVHYDGKGNKLSESQYERGVLHGASRQWGGGWQLLSEKTYDRGLLHGLSRSTNGYSVTVLNYEADRLHGPYLLAQSLIEGTYANGKPVGKWIYYLQGGGRLIGDWDEGRPAGTWELYTTSRLTMAFDGGQLVAAQPDILEPRLADLLAQGAINNPKVIRSLYSFSRADFVKMPFRDVCDFLAISHDIALQISPEALAMRPEILTERPVALPLMPRDPFGDPPPLGTGGSAFLSLPRDALPGMAYLSEVEVTCQLDNAPLIAILRTILEPLALVCDYRHGAVWITTPEAVAAGDRTGIPDVAPPPGSHLALVWERPAEIEFIEMPLNDALAFLQIQYNVEFDTSRLPEAFRNRTSLTVNSRGSAFKHVLGHLLERALCRASLDGETIVIELQDEHSSPGMEP